MQTINFDREKLRRLKTAYDRAVKQGNESFMFDGNELLTAYAKYLIEYLTDKFKTP
jgi:hypothetical protein